MISGGLAGCEDYLSYANEDSRAGSFHEIPSNTNTKALVSFRFSSIARPTSGVAIKSILYYVMMSTTIYKALAVTLMLQIISC